MNTNYTGGYRFVEGLPNLGNTCYINSIIQFLYASEKFRDRIEQSPRNLDESTLTSHIQNIFASIKGDDIMNKHLLMRKLIQKVQQIQSRIVGSRQQDAFQILMLILNQLFWENQGFEELFTLQTKNLCECGEYTTRNVFLMNSDRICYTCHQNIKIRVQKESNLLIVSNNKEDLNNPEGSLIKEFNDNELRYRCIAKMFYIGNGQIGHYKASRLSDGIFIQFNDSTGYLEYDKNPLYQLYQKLQRESLPRHNAQAIEEVNHKQINENNTPVVGQIYRSKLNLVYKITASKVIKQQRIIYFSFKQTEVQRYGYMLEMIIFDYQEQIGVKQQYRYQKTYPDQHLKEDPIFYISCFLKQHEQHTNRRIQNFFHKGGFEKKNKFSKLFYESSKSENDKYKHLPFIEVVRNR